MLPPCIAAMILIVLTATSAGTEVGLMLVQVNLGGRAKSGCAHFSLLAKQRSHTGAVQCAGIAKVSFALDNLVCWQSSGQYRVG